MVGWIATAMDWVFALIQTYLFPDRPEKTQEEMIELCVREAFKRNPDLNSQEATDIAAMVRKVWCSPRVYYFIDVPDLHLWKQFKSILRLDVSAVNFWKHRRKHRREYLERRKSKPSKGKELA